MVRTLCICALLLLGSVVVVVVIVVRSTAGAVAIAVAVDADSFLADCCRVCGDEHAPQQYTSTPAPATHDEGDASMFIFLSTASTR